MGIDYVMQKEVERTKQPMLAFVSKSPHKTWWLQLAYHEEAIPTRLIADLEVAGWTENKTFFGASPFNGVTKLDVQCKGTDLFGGWKPKERESAMSKCRQVLRQHGYPAIPHYQLTLADCL